MPAGGLAIGGGMVASGLIGGLMGQAAAKDAAAQAAQSRAQAQANMERAVAELQKLGIPSVQAQQILLQKPELVGQLTAQKLGPSAMEGVQAPQALQSAQMASLAGLQQRAESGLTPQDRYNMMQIENQNNANNQSQQKSILQDYAMRNQGDTTGGAALAAQLGAQQGGANAANQNSMALVANVQNARQNALEQYGNQAGQMRNQDVNEQTQIAKAKDLINQFNLQNSQSVAQENLANRQNIANQGVGIANQQEAYNKGLIGQNYGQQFQKAQATGNAMTGQANMFQNAAGQQLQAGQNAAQGYANMGSGAATSLGSVGGWMYGKKSTPSTNNEESSSNSGGYNYNDANNR